MVKTYVKSPVWYLTLSRFSTNLSTALAVDWFSDEILTSRNNHHLVDDWQVYAHRIQRGDLLETSTYLEFQSHSGKDEWVWSEALYCQHTILTTVLFVTTIAIIIATSPDAWNMPQTLLVLSLFFRTSFHSTCVSLGMRKLKARVL